MRKFLSVVGTILLILGLVAILVGTAFLGMHWQAKIGSVFIFAGIAGAALAAILIKIRNKKYTQESR